MRTTILISAGLISEALNPALWESYTVAIGGLVILFIGFLYMDVKDFLRRH